MRRRKSSLAAVPASCWLSPLRSDDEGSDAVRAYKEKLLKAADSDKLILWMPTYRHASSERMNEETLNNEFNIPILDDKERLLAFNNFCRDNHVLVVIRSIISRFHMTLENVMTNIVYLENQDLGQWLAAL